MFCHPPIWTKVYLAVRVICMPRSIIRTLFLTMLFDHRYTPYQRLCAYCHTTYRGLYTGYGYRFRPHWLRLGMLINGPGSIWVALRHYFHPTSSY